VDYCIFVLLYFECPYHVLIHVSENLIQEYHVLILIRVSEIAIQGRSAAWAGSPELY